MSDEAAIERLRKLADSVGNAVKLLLPEGTHYTLVLTAATGEPIDIGLASTCPPGRCADVLEASAEQIRICFGLDQDGRPKTTERPS